MYKICAYAQTPMEQVLCFLAQNRFLRWAQLNFCNAQNHFLAVNMIVYDMQVWCDYVLFEIPLNFMTLWTVFTMACMNMGY